MKIKQASLLAIFILIAACSSTDKQEKIAYVIPKPVIPPSRSAQDRAKTLTELGLVYYQLEKYNYAKEKLTAALKLDNKNATTYQIFALIKQRSNQPEQAQAYFDQALKLEPDNFDILTAYAVFLYEKKRYKESLSKFNQIASAPFYEKKWVAYSYLGLYNLQNKQQRKAEINFYKALQANPKYSLALFEVAKIRYAKGEMMSARAYIERYFGVAGKTLNGLKLAIKIETALQTHDLAETYKIELKRHFPFSATTTKNQ